MRTALLPVLFTMMLSAACSSESEPSVCRAPPAGATTQAASCQGDLSVAAIPVETFRAHAVRTSSTNGAAQRILDGFMGAAGACLAELYVGALANAVVGAVTGQPVNTQPDCSDNYRANHRYDFADGTYTLYARQTGQVRDGQPVVDTESSAAVRLFFARDVGTFTRGQVVPYDVHLPETFLVGARIYVENNRLLVSYDSTGPLVELLGAGPTPPNPMPLTDKTRSSVASGLELEGTTRAELMDCEYRTVMAHTLARTVLSADQHPTLVSAVTTSSSDPNVRVVARTWDLTYSAAAMSGAPTGTIEVDVFGLAPLRAGTLSFTDTTGNTAALELGCAAP